MFNREEAIVDVTAGRCPCDACNGKLSDGARSQGGWGFCGGCECAWQVSEIDQKINAATVPGDRHLKT